MVHPRSGVVRGGWGDYFVTAIPMLTVSLMTGSPLSQLRYWPAVLLEIHQGTITPVEH